MPYSDDFKKFAVEYYYVCSSYRKAAKDLGGSPASLVTWDNAVTESLMGVIKSECVHARTFDSREQAAIELFEYIERFYNRLRIHSALGWLSPAEFEAAHRKEDRPRAA